MPAVRNKEDERNSAILQSKAKREKFVTDYSIVAFTSQQALKANPFPFKDKVVGLRADFVQMVGSGEALFGDLFVINVPNTAFTSPGLASILAVKIAGVRPIKILGTEIPLPYGNYVGVYMCTTTDCRDFVGPTN
jgi:hypothetical protein